MMIAARFCGFLFGHVLSSFHAGVNSSAKVLTLLTLYFIEGIERRLINLTEL